MNCRLVLLLLAALPAGLSAQDREAMTRAWRSGLAPRPAYADSLPNALTAAIPRSVREAEAEGAKWPRREAGTTQRGDAAKPWETSVPRKCMTAETSRPLRSGEFNIGGELVSGPRPGGQVKIWWEPMHPFDSLPLVVRGVSLTNPADTLRQMMKDISRGGRPPMDWSGPFFYPSGFWFPASGRFLVVATSGTDWGCFILSH
jgi:hypothetical protein